MTVQTATQEGEGRVTRDWQFAVGERVRCNGDWGVLICDLSIRYEDEPDAVYVIHEVAGDGRWVSLRDESTGKIYGECLRSYGGRPGIGPGYFRIAGECGIHRPTYDSGSLFSDRQPGFYCARCDAPLPEASSRYWMSPDRTPSNSSTSPTHDPEDRKVKDA
jgi:hypothetical protein